MRKSWKTTLCGIIGAAMSAATATPGLPAWGAHLLGIGASMAVSIGLLFSRDNNVTSEDAGATRVTPTEG